MSSLLTNTSAMNALATMRNVNSTLNETQTRISTGLKVRSGKENAAYFSISSEMKGDAGMYKSINEGLTLTKNSLATARLGAETVKDLAKQFVERVSFATGEGVDRESVQEELDALAVRMDTAIDQSTFNGNNLVDSTSTVTVVTGISRSSGSFAATTMEFQEVDLSTIQSTLDGIDISSISSSASMQTILTNAEGQLSNAIDAATSLGIAEKSVETQQSFLTKLADNIDEGVGSMVDADMEEEAARLQAYQVQSQLAVQSLSIANQQPQSLLSLFR